MNGMVLWRDGGLPIESTPQLLGPVGGPTPPPVDDPSREIRLGVIIAVLFFVVFLGWAAFARMDAAAYAQGRLVVSGQRQSVQHRDGGIVTKIFVREGQRVEKGELLMRLAGAEVQAEERSLMARWIGLVAQQARLRSEQMGTGSIAPPPEFASLDPEDRPIADEAMKLQQAQMTARAELLSTRRSVIGQQSAQAAEEREGYRRQMVSSAKQSRLLEEELRSLEGVAAKGFVSKSRLRALERSKAELEGRTGQYAATMASSREAAAQARLQIVEAERAHQEQIADELREVETALAEVQPKLRAAREQLSRTEIRSPVTGTVVGLSVFNAGSVIAPGQKLLDVVPDRMPLVIEAKVSPGDVDDLAVGDETRVRFASLHDRTIPDLQGRLTMLSADSFDDERTGEAFFRAEIRVPDNQLELLRDRHGRELRLRAGMPVEVLIPVRPRTALQYAFEPLRGAFWRSFHEQ